WSQRGRKRQRQLKSLDDADAWQSSRNRDADLRLEEQRLMLQRALQELPEKERAAVVLRDIEGLSTADVAEILGSSEATVRSQISTARIKIRKAIQRLKRGRK